MIARIVFFVATVTFLSIRSLDAGLVFWTPGVVDVTTPPPANITPGNWESSTSIRFFTERQNFVLPIPLTVDVTIPSTVVLNPDLSIGTLGAGTIVDSFYIHVDPINRTSGLLSGRLVFDRDILGIIVGTFNGVNTVNGGMDGDTHDVSNQILGRSGITYGREPLEVRFGDDPFTLSTDRRTLDFSFAFGTVGDNMRITTQATSVPEPTSFLLAFTAIVTSHRRSRRNASLSSDRNVT
jgi:hypothetical protein